MPTEQEELQLIVNFVDNASAGIAKLRDEMKNLGGGSTAQGMEKFKREQNSLKESSKGLTEEVMKTYDAVGVLGKTAIATTAGVAFLGYEIYKQIGQINEWSKAMREMSQIAASIGVRGAHFKNIIEQFEAAGVSAETTTANMIKMSEAIADISRQGSQLRERLVREAGAPGSGAARAMDEMLTKLAQAKDQEEQINILREARLNIERNALREGYNAQEAADRATKAMAPFYDRTLGFVGEIKRKTDEQYEADERRMALGKEYSDQLGELESTWGSIKDIMLSLPLPLLISGLKEINGIVSGVLWTFEKIETIVRYLATFLPKEAETGVALGGSGTWVGKKLGLIPDDAKPDPLAGKSDAERLHALRPSAPGAPMSESERLRQIMEQNRKAQEDNTKAQKDQTDALKKNMSYRDDGTGAGNPLLQQASFRDMVQQAAFTPGGFTAPSGGAPMFGGGGGSWGGGAGPVTGGESAAQTGGAYGYGGDAQGGRSAFPGGGAGGAAPNGSDVGGGNGAAGSPAPGNGEVGPAAALAYARQHLGEDEIRDQTKLSGFFREHGIKINPATTAWCAAFVNANLSQAGIKGTGSLAAGSFNKWGVGVKGGDVEAGDVGVVRGVSPRTGIEGVHVGMMTGNKRVNPQTGELEVEMLGGNQGGTASGKGGVSTQWRRASSLNLRRAGPNELPNGQTAGPGTGAGAGDTPAHADGAKGAGGGRGGELYGKLLTEFQQSNLKGVVPRGGAQFGIKTGSPEEWAKFGVSVAHAESGFDPKTKNLSDPGGSFGVFQYAHGQVPGGNAYDVDASVKAFVRDSESSAADPRGLRGGILGRRFSTIGKHPAAGAAYLSEAEKLAEAREQLDRSQVASTKVEGSGKISVDVNAPKGTSVDAEGKGLFKDVEINRQTQMEPAKRSATNNETMNI